MRSASGQWRHYAWQALRPANGSGELPSPLQLWESETTPAVWRFLRGSVARVGRPGRTVIVATVAFLLGVGVAAPRGAAGPDTLDRRERVKELERSLATQQAELALARIELERLRAVADFSTRYRIPAGLAASIHDIALAEGLDPWLAFQLVRVESGFSPTAVSPKGAVGLTQIMPSTAEALAPGISHDALFEPETNLRLGFRYLRYLIERYGGDLRLALLAYNRGPGTVDAIRSAGGDASNGYAEAVMGNRQPGGTLTARASVGASP